MIFLSIHFLGPPNILSKKHQMKDNFCCAQKATPLQRFAKLGIHDFRPGWI